MESPTLPDSLPAGLDPASARDIRRLSRTALLVLAVGVLGLGLWAGLAPLSGAVVAPGSVKVDLNRKTVQHQDGGLVRKVLVRNGDRVAAGQPLIELDDVRVDATLDLLRNQFDAERARFARLGAEKSLAPGLVFPPDLLARRAGDRKLRELLERERTLFDARRQALDSQVELLKTQIAQTATEAEALASQIAAEERALALQRDELAANRDLLEKNFVQKTRILALERAVADYEARLGEHKAELAKARQRGTDLELRIVALRSAYTQGAADSLRDSNSRIFELEERLRPSLDAAQRQTIVAPASGEVVDLRVTSPGAVIGPREALLDIVPSEPRLIVEGRLRTEDINYVKVGGEVDVQLSALKGRTTPTVAGRITYVSADKLVDRATNQPYYEINVDVPAESLRRAGDLRLVAGMPVELFIRTGERTALEYLLDPIAVFLRRAAREP